MSFEQRAYNNSLFRPRPEVHIEPDNQLLIVATPWGPRSAAKKVCRTIVDQFSSSRDDHESTSPFARLTCLSSAANDLRAAVYFANDSIYSEDNKSEYTAGLEILALARQESEITLVQVGQPTLILDRRNQPLRSLGTGMDLAAEFGTSSNFLPPLPGHLLGLASTSNFVVTSFRPAAGDRLVLINHSQIPGSFYSLPEEKRSLDDLSSHLIDQQPDQPFWLGIFGLSD